MCQHYNDEVDEVNAKLTTFISNLNYHYLRPVVPPPIQITYANITTLKVDGTTTNTTLQASTQQDFISQLKEYISQIDDETTSISKKKVFDDLNIKKNRKDLFLTLKSVLSQVRPDITLKHKE